MTRNGKKARKRSLGRRNLSGREEEEIKGLGRSDMGEDSRKAQRAKILNRNMQDCGLENGRNH